MNVLLIGLGFFSQNVHFRFLKKNKNIKNIFIYDERPILLSKFSKKNKVVPIKKSNLKSLKNIDFAIVSVDRNRTFKYSKLILSQGKAEINEFSDGLIKSQKSFLRKF